MMMMAEKVERLRVLLEKSTTVITRPVWAGDDGMLRIGHSGDLVEMLNNVGIDNVP